ncbi:MAG: hypothetical protein ACTSX6_04595 [Candidatus Heimdallarchaeaceae archaeon]
MVKYKRESAEELMKLSKKEIINKYFYMKMSSGRLKNTKLKLLVGHHHIQKMLRKVCNALECIPVDKYHKVDIMNVIEDLRYLINHPNFK